ncbi:MULTISPECIES: Rid family detoxifying hydrolase [unclassified Chryseobacterium]|uniref:Rid family detoxifying hydrolase n=1 Tax=unclassified Chryseobacterium TaxID=2593645 RepID=UPI001AEADF77|nr:MULTISPECIES: Rid family detoxifying hydrolase [unclassified Chryseobacterium]MBP1164059.1 2-iminobutanoate/2-iminopropanoate deaminase [Chryseobacterium sp. PvR013]MDR4892131.1 Rid family detoxifying hydrolase [Chryseobacterium sp. CFS7]
MQRFILFFITLTLFSCSTTKHIVAVKHNGLPEAIGPYSHSTSYGNLIFVSGQIGLDQKTNTLKNGIEEQMVQIMENLKIILENNQSDFQHITKTTIFLADIKQFETVNKIYSQYFHTSFPSRSTIEVRSLPRNAAVEIECIAVKR